MYKVYARHCQAKGVADAWWLVYVGFEALGKDAAIENAYKKLLSYRGDLDETTVRERYDVNVLRKDCETEVFDPEQDEPVECGVFGIFCPECEFKLEVKNG